MRKSLELDVKLGPFYDDGEEFIPVGMEESLPRLAESLGYYELKSNLDEMNGKDFEINEEDITKFIQEDWDRVTNPDPQNRPRRGFLLAYSSPTFAAGRVAEEVILQKLFNGSSIFGTQIAKIYLAWEAKDSGIIQVPQKGPRCDDMVLINSDGELMLVEAKATFKSTNYLKRALGKLERQIKSTLAVNPTIHYIIACLIDIRKHFIVLIGLKREKLIEDKLNKLVKRFLVT